MGWREAWVCKVERDDPDGLTYKLLDRLSAALLDISAPDRIALARELLKGTGWVPARAVARRKLPGAMRTESALDYAQGWNACRAAMLGDEP